MSYIRVDNVSTTDDQHTASVEDIVKVTGVKQELASPSGAAMVGRGAMTVASIADLVELPEGLRKSDMSYAVTGYHPGTIVGGGPFIWDASRPKVDHNGCTVVDPDKVFPSNWSELSVVDAWYQAENTGSGCFVRVVESGKSITVKDFGGVCDGEANDDAAFGAWLAYLGDNADKDVSLGDGVITLSRTKAIPRQATGLAGLNEKSGQRVGPARRITTLKWVGGASPIFTTDVTRLTFRGFDVETNGQATDFLEMNAGSQALYMDEMNIATGSFTRSVIRSNGNRAGYSYFRRIVATKSAPAFLDVDGQGTPNSITPISFDLCQFAGTGAGGNDSWTIVKIKDETIEAVRFNGCTLISRGGLVLVDTTESPLSSTIQNLSIKDNEIDNVEGSDFRMFKLSNVKNIALDDNVISGDGSCNYLFDLTNSNVTSVKGNYVKSVNYLFGADDNSRIRGVGHNEFDFASTEGISDNIRACVQYLDTTAFSIFLDGAKFAPAEPAIYVAEFLPGGAGGSYAIRLDLTKPENMEPGQEFTVVVKNSSGGAIAAPNFTTGFKRQAAAFTAPANGHSRAYRFYFDGVNAIQVGPEGPEIPN